MKGFLLRFLVSMAALYLTSIIAQSLGIGIRVETAAGAALAVIVMGLVNASIGPVLRLMAMPLNCMTLGLIGLLINILLFWLVGALVPGYEVNGFIAAAFGSVVMGLVSGLLNSLVATKE